MVPPPAFARVLADEEDPILSAARNAPPAAAHELPDADILESFEQLIAEYHAGRAPLAGLADVRATIEQSRRDQGE